MPDEVIDDTQGPQDTGGENDQLNNVSDTPDATTVDAGSDSNPMWQSYVEKFPTSLHGVAKEVFTEWDGNVTKRFQDLHSTYEPYKNYVEEWEPEAIGQALALAQALESDPQAFYQALAKSYGLGDEQGTANQQQVDTPPLEFGEDDPYAARFQEQETLLRSLADHILGQENAQREAAEAAESEALLDQALSTLKQQYGEYDENYVLNAIANGADAEDAVKQFQQMVGTWATKQNSPASNAPQIMGAGGGLPSNQVDPSSLNSKDTKALVAQILASGQG